MRKLILALALALPAFSQALFFGQNFQATGTDALSGSVSTSVTSANLTTLGTSDWINYGNGSGSCPSSQANSKSSGGSQIGTYTQVAGPFTATGATGFPVAFTWTDGTPNSSASGVTGGCYGTGFSSGQGFTFTIPASAANHTAIVYVSCYNSTPYSMNAHLSDDTGHVTDYNDTGTCAGSVNTPFTYTFTNYHAASNGQTLVITWTMPTVNGQASLALQGAIYQ